MTSLPLSAPGPRIFPTPNFVFEPIPQAVTCQSLALTWFYNGPSTSFDFIATNAGVSQDAPVPPLTSFSSTTRGPFTGTDGKQRRAIHTGAANPMSNVTVFVASNIDPSSQAYPWQAVDVPQGWYQIIAISGSQGYTSPATQFFVHTGNDISCLAAITSSSTTSPTSTPTSAILTTPSASSSAALPIGGASRVNSGAIAGASVGGVFLLAAVLAAWFCLQRRGKGGVGALTSRSPRKWNGLSSVDSRALTSGNQKNFSSHRHQSRSESMGTIPMGASEEAVGMEKSSIYGKYNENYGPLDGPGVALAAMPVLHHQEQQQQPRSKANSRAYSVSSSNEYLPNEGVIPGRRPSVPESVIGRQSTDSSNTYPPISPVSPHGGRNGPSNQFMAANVGRSHSSSTSIAQPSSSSSPTQSTSSHAFPHQYQRPAPSPSPQPPTISDAATKKANRNSLGGKRRKPVPAYDPTQEDAASLPVPRANATPSPAPSSISPHTPTMNPGSGGGGHYATRSQMDKDSSQHDLVHKSSFGPGGVEGKPLHYLIPDMPMQSKE